MSDMYPNTCPACNSAAYEGATAVECTNQKCVHWDGNGPAEPAPFEGMLIGGDGGTIWTKACAGAPKVYWTDDEGVDHELKGADGGAFTVPVLNASEIPKSRWSEGYSRGLRCAAETLEAALAATDTYSTLYGEMYALAGELKEAANAMAPNGLHLGESLGTPCKSSDAENYYEGMGITE